MEKTEHIGANECPALNCRDANVETRAGRCLELSFWGAFRSKTWSLVHSETIGPKGVPRMLHAWLEQDGWVYDPILDKTFPWVIYEAAFDAVRFKAFTWDELNECISKHQHFGPWPDEYKVSS